eukprot:CAMPEP_0176053986 /NCGR_PEP_ID=MMETSP0120_2-20121206/26858_1 /TAXON_ID=160619 /ORGANISM="Kryptoperidinium foliaceum, Strain CCMP 1326" /LENGTH=484 /DNA_ID=CAMNT_0017387449 /DNA_START=14 /DNA_END=1468 /DNA_ORIENTATION=-
MATTASRAAVLAALLAATSAADVAADDVARVLSASGGEADDACDSAFPEDCEAAALALRQLRGIRRHSGDADDDSSTTGTPGALKTSSVWTPWSEDLGRPSTAPLYTFYMYRAVSDEIYDPVNVNAANLPGVLWYLHHEVVVQYPRKFKITGIDRFKVQMRATEALVKKGMHFGPRMAMDLGQATGPFVCGRQNNSQGYSEPSFCDGPFDSAKEFDIIASNGKPYGLPFEYGRYGFNVGCNNLGEYPFPMYDVYYPKAVWYTLPGPCPSKTFDSTDAACKAREPGGLCKGVPTGEGNCTWSYEHMGHVTIDDFVDTPVDKLNEAGGREYDPYTDKGIKTDFWDGINNTEANALRIKKLRKLFADRFPNQTLDEEMPSPPCDFDFGEFYKEFWWRPPFAGECMDAMEGDDCYTMAKWGKTEGIYSHPEYYPGLTTASTMKDFQQLLYMQGKPECPHRPCGIAGGLYDSASKAKASGAKDHQGVKQ